MPIIEITREKSRGPAARQIPGSSWDEDRGAWSFDPAANDHAAAIAAALFPELRESLRQWLPDEASSDTRGKPVLRQVEAVTGPPAEPTTERTNQGGPSQPMTVGATRSGRRDSLIWWMLGVGFVLVLCVAAWRPWASEPLCANYQGSARDSGYPCRIEHSNGTVEHLFIDDATGAVRSASTAPSGGLNPLAIGAGLSAAALLVLGGAYVRMGRAQTP